MSHKHDSENEDDPEPYQSSGDEWSLEKAKKEEGGRRKSARISRKPQKPVFDESEDDIFSEESSTEELKKRKNRKRPVGRPPTKKKKVSNDSDISMDASSNNSQEGNGLKKVNDKEKEITSTDSDSPKTVLNTSKSVQRKFLPKTIFSEDFVTGSFVILKKDAQACDSNKRPSIWRIDGKALLQKYEAIDEDSKIRHKNTSVYTGWSPLDKDLYVPLTVNVIKHNNSNLTVEVQWEKLKVINVDSD